MFNFRPKHELEVPTLVPLYIEDLTPFLRDKPLKSVKKTDNYSRQLNAKELNPDDLPKKL